MLFPPCVLPEVLTSDERRASVYIITWNVEIGRSGHETRPLFGGEGNSVCIGKLMVDGTAKATSRIGMEKSPLTDTRVRRQYAFFTPLRHRLGRKQTRKLTSDYLKVKAIGPQGLHRPRGSTDAKYASKNTSLSRIPVRLCQFHHNTVHPINKLCQSFFLRHRRVRAAQ